MATATLNPGKQLPGLRRAIAPRLVGPRLLRRSARLTHGQRGDDAGELARAGRRSRSTTSPAATCPRSTRAAACSERRCLANDVAGRQLGLICAPIRSSGDGYYYLVRAQSACDSGNYGADSSGAFRRVIAACP